MANKITKAQMFSMIMALDEVQANPEMVNFIQHEIDLLNKKSSSKKATKTQEENVALMEVVLKALATTDKAVTISEIQALDPVLSGFSNQKISALVYKLVDEKKVVKTSDKKKSLFSLPC